MRRRTSTQVVLLCGGGPADGESREIEEGTVTIVVHDGPIEPDADAVTTAHLYELRADGRFHHDGVFEVDAHPELPAPTHEDPRAMGLAALGHEKGPSFTAVVSFLVFLAVVMAFYYEYTH